MAPWGPCWLHDALACHNAALRSAAAPGPSTDQEALQEDFLGPLQALGGLGGQWQAAEIADLGGGHLRGREDVVAGIGAVAPGAGQFGEPGKWRR
jgi:hypothetical protein